MGTIDNRDGTMLENDVPAPPLGIAAVLSAIDQDIKTLASRQNRRESAPLTPAPRHKHRRHNARRDRDHGRNSIRKPVSTPERILHRGRRGNLLWRANNTVGQFVGMVDGAATSHPPHNRHATPGDRRQHRSFRPHPETCRWRAPGDSSRKRAETVTTLPDQMRGAGTRRQPCSTGLRQLRAR